MWRNRKALKASLQFRLSLSLSVVILLVALAAGVFSFFAAFDEAHAWQDETLRQIANLFEQQNIVIDNYLSTKLSASGNRKAHINIQVLPSEMQPVLPNGFQTITIENKSYRAFISRNRVTQQRILISQDTSERDEIARDGALRTLAPFMALMLVLLIVVRILISQIFKPILQASIELDQRDEFELHPIASDSLPTEFRPFAAAINRLFKRITHAVEKQKMFIADAAHELRTPLTALSLQVERLGATELSEEAQQRLKALKEGIARSSVLVEQLLTLARVQAAQKRRVEKIEMEAILRQVVEGLLPLIEEKKIKLNILGVAHEKIQAERLDACTLVKNLLDNAVRYTPISGMIDVTISTSKNHVTLSVKDSGPGIPPEEQMKVFDAFYRIDDSEVSGSGLGLSIVHTITERLGANIELKNTHQQTQTGLCISVTFPELVG